jgi:hypothetical protein
VLLFFKYARVVKKELNIMDTLAEINLILFAFDKKNKCTLTSWFKKVETSVGFIEKNTNPLSLFLIFAFVKPKDSFFNIRRFASFGLTKAMLLSIKPIKFLLL